MKIEDAAFALIDCETTRGDVNDPEMEACEIAVEVVGGDQRSILRADWLIRPDFYPMPPDVSGVHNLTDEDLVDGWKRVDVDDMLYVEVRLTGKAAVMVAHHTDFDRKVIANNANDLDKLPWLCTERLGHHLVPDAPNFKLQTLRYLFGHKKVDMFGLDPHRAMADVQVLKAVFFSLLDCYAAHVSQTLTVDVIEEALTVEALLDFAAKPYLLKRIPFGKHRGTLFGELDLGYMRWMQRSMEDMDADLKWTVESEIARRAGKEVLL